MAGKIIDDVSQAITAVSGGTLTVASTTGFYDGAYGYLSKAGQAGVTVRIIHVLSATQLTVRQELDPRGGGVGTTGADIRSNSYSLFPATAYNGGAISLPAQVVYNSGDLPLV